MLNGKCASCIGNSSVIYNGSNTNIEGCKCNKDQYWLDNMCTYCPNNYLYDGTRCCPAGSSSSGPGDKIVDGCYCLKDHTLVDGKCKYEITNEYIASIIIPDPPFAADEPELIILSTNIPITPTPSSLGISGLEMFMLSSDKNFYLKQIIFEYTEGIDTTPKQYIPVEYTDLFYIAPDLDDKGYIPPSILLNKTWTFKRIIIDLNYTDINYSNMMLNIVMANDLAKIAINQPPSLGVMYEIDVKYDFNNARIALNIE
jgi:hypothetical protein